ncbi:MAG: patatin-like phospholipase family protein [Acidobacteriaceae bacterium]
MPNNPKIGIALSGASGRAIAHIGVLEVLRENNIPIDVITGCSSGALIAASYATGTMVKLREFINELTLGKLFRMMSAKEASGGLFHLRGAHKWIENFTKGKKFEEVQPKLGFVATDLDTGELITISKGDLLTAFKATTAVPGLFEPMIIDGKILVDGGLVNIVPTEAARAMGADIVIGVNIAATKFIYEKRLPIWKGYRLFTRLLGLQFIREKLLAFSSRMFFQIDTQSDFLEEDDIQVPGTISVLAKALDHSLAISQQWTDSNMACDLMLEPRVKHLAGTDFSKFKEIYEEGRRSARVAVPEIKKIIENFSKQPAAETKQIVKPA